MMRKILLTRYSPGNPWQISYWIASLGNILNSQYIYIYISFFLLLLFLFTFFLLLSLFSFFWDWVLVYNLLYGKLICIDVLVIRYRSYSLAPFKVAAKISNYAGSGLMS